MLDGETSPLRAHRLLCSRQWHHLVGCRPGRPGGSVHAGLRRRGRADRASRLHSQDHGGRQGGHYRVGTTKDFLETFEVVPRSTPANRREFRESICWQKSSAGVPGLESELRITERGEQSRSFATIDMAVLYSSKFQSDYGGVTGAASQVQAAVDYLERALAKSGVNAGVRIVYSGVATQLNGSNSLDQLLDRAQNDSSIAALKNEYGADVVHCCAERSLRGWHRNLRSRLCPAVWLNLFELLAFCLCSDQRLDCLRPQRDSGTRSGPPARSQPRSR